MQFAYQFPERCERLVLVVAAAASAREVHLAAARRDAAGRRVRAAAARVGPACSAPAPRSARVLGALGLRAERRLDGIARGFASLADADARRAFLHTARSVIDPGGQRVDATDRLYLAARVPSLIVWGERDPIIPVEHGRTRARGDARTAGSRSSKTPATSRTSTIRTASRSW